MLARLRARNRSAPAAERRGPTRGLSLRRHRTGARLRRSQPQRQPLLVRHATLLTAAATHARRRRVGLRGDERRRVLPQPRSIGGPQDRPHGLGLAVWVASARRATGTRLRRLRRRSSEPDGTESLPLRAAAWRFRAQLRAGARVARGQRLQHRSTLPRWDGVSSWPVLAWAARASVLARRRLRERRALRARHLRARGELSRIWAAPHRAGSPSL